MSDCKAPHTDTDCKAPHTDTTGLHYRCMLIGTHVGNHVSRRSDDTYEVWPNSSLPVANPNGSRSGNQPVQLMETQRKENLMSTTITEPQLFPNDWARTRLTDPWSSHLGADRSQDSIPAVKAAVIAMIRWEGALTGSQLNRMYQVEAKRQGWPEGLHFDSPRKRAGELAADGLLRVLNADVPRGTEREYTLLGVTS